MGDSVELVPKATDLVRSIRGLGYSAPVALGDLVDNSISAGAQQVQIGFEWNDGDPFVVVLDDGEGMPSYHLIEAMRLGRDPAETRNSSDLGRFGMGLKTASLSQARILTVATRYAGGVVNTARWDIDHIQVVEKWGVQLGVEVKQKEVLSRLEQQSSGTLVIWEELDQLFGSGKRSLDQFLQVAEASALHLGMIYHRYIEGERLALVVNGSVVRPWDPFARADPNCIKHAPRNVESESRRTQAVVTGYILPSPAKLSPELDDLYGGPNGWIAQQGFYVYRSDRLVVSGGWLGLGRAGRPWRLDREHVLARLSLDIPTKADIDWSLDIRKSTLVPPEEFRRPLQRLAQEIRRLAKATLVKKKRAVIAKSERGADGDLPSLWISERVGTVTRFRIDRRHPLVSDLRRSLENLPPFQALLDRIDAEMPLIPSLPAQVIQPANTIQLAQTASVTKLARNLYYSLRKGIGLDPDVARLRVISIPTFRDYELVVSVALEAYESELQRIAT